jgi:small-conductance mechanosensitive channel
MGDAVLKSAYFAVVLYACVSIVIGLLVIALRTRPLSLLGMVQRHQALLLTRLTRAVRWAAAAAWVYGLLAALSVASATFDLFGRAFTAQVGFAEFHVSLGPLTEFLLIMWASFIVSRFLRFVLEEDVYERLPLPGGSAYAISKVLNYIVLLVGFFVALHVLNYNMTQFTILASAFGVGLGFGMQNIVNNFVSGLILLFERPVKVGDVIQMGDVNGIVSYIGIRASVLRTPDSSEIIIPNGNLISSQVTNWTHTNRLRGLTIPISIAATADPKHVMDLMTRTAADNSQIVKSPAPQAFLIKFSSDTFNYELHVWTNEAVHWIHIRSDLSVALNAAFVKENIPIR